MPTFHIALRIYMKHASTFKKLRNTICQLKCNEKAVHLNQFIIYNVILL